MADLIQVQSHLPEMPAKQRKDIGRKRHLTHNTPIIAPFLKDGKQRDAADAFGASAVGAHTHGLAPRLSCRVPTRAALLSLSSPLAKVWPTNASRLNRRHRARSHQFCRVICAKIEERSNKPLGYKKRTGSLLIPVLFL